MPIYLYRKDDDELVEVRMTIAQMQRRQRKDGSIRMPDGSRGVRDIPAEQRGGKSHPANWPMYSDAAGVHPSQIEEFTKLARDAGVPTDFLPDGRAKLESARHRRDYLRTRNLHDRNACYGDP